MRAVLVRHPAPAIAPGLCYGRMDIGLGPTAGQEIGLIASSPAMHGATQVWTSPALRCRLLADAIAATLQRPTHVDGRLHELDFGAWEGQRWDDIARTELDRWAACPLEFASPGGESGRSLIARVGAFHSELRRTGEDCIVVSHGGPLKVLTALLSGVPVDLLAAPPPLGSLGIITVPPGQGQSLAAGCGPRHPCEGRMDVPSKE